MDELKTEKTNDAIHEEALKRFKIAQDAEAENRQLALDDLHFANGDQWPDDIRRERNNRPCLTLNKMPQFIKQVVNNQRINKPSIKVSPVDSKGDPDTAEVLSGLIRNIETVSRAESAYDCAFESAVRIGFGYFRVTTDYEDADTFTQDIAVKRIINPFTVYLDPYYKEADASDIEYCFVTEMFDKDDFKDKYGIDATEVSVESQDYDEWYSDDRVRVAEYWRVVTEDYEIVELVDGRVVPKADLPLPIPDGVITNTRTSTKRTIEQYIMTGQEIIEEAKWAGKWIPIVPVLGEETDIEGKRSLKGLIRDSKDAQRLYNLWRSSSAEYVANQPKAPYIGPTGAFKTDAKKWATANSKSYAYIGYDGSIPPQRQAPPPIPAGIIQEAVSASDDMKSIMGLHDASLGARSNEVSGIAIKTRQQQGNIATFNFVDNLTRAMKHCGRILVDLIPKVYDTERVIRVIGPDEETEMVAINQMFVDEKTREQKQHQLGVGKYDVTISVGPSYGTQREEAAESMVALIQAYPPAAPVMGDILAKNLDWPGADEIAKRLKSLLPPGVDDDEDQGIPKRVAQQMQEAINALKQENQMLNAEIKSKHLDADIKAAEIAVDKEEVQVKRAEVQVKGFEAETDRLNAELDRRKTELGLS